MKAFIASIILLSVVIVGVWINSLYIRSTAEEMKSLALAVCEAEDGREDSLSKLNSYWEKHKKTVCLSVSFRDVDEITEYVIRLSCAVQIGDNEDIWRCYNLLKNSLDDVARYEKIYFSTIF